jgi:hypothetical protein
MVRSRGFNGIVKHEDDFRADHKDLEALVFACGQLEE